MGLSTYAKDKLIQNLVSLADWNGPGTTYVGLFTADPGPSGDSNEVAVSEYERQEVTWTLDGLQVENASAVSFPTAQVDWGKITHFAAFDAQTGGNQLFSDTVASSDETIDAGQQAHFSAGNLTTEFKEVTTDIEELESEEKLPNTGSVGERYKITTGGKTHIYEWSPKADHFVEIAHFFIPSPIETVHTESGPWTRLDQNWRTIDDFSDSTLGDWWEVLYGGDRLTVQSDHLQYTAPSGSNDDAFMRLRPAWFPIGVDFRMLVADFQSNSPTNTNSVHHVRFDLRRPTRSWFYGNEDRIYRIALSNQELESRRGNINSWDDDANNEFSDQDIGSGLNDSTKYWLIAQSSPVPGANRIHLWAAVADESMNVISSVQTDMDPLGWMKATLSIGFHRRNDPDVSSDFRFYQIDARAP